MKNKWDRASSIAEMIMFKLAVWPDLTDMFPIPLPYILLPIDIHLRHAKAENERIRPLKRDDISVGNTSEPNIDFQGTCHLVFKYRKSIISHLPD